MTDYPGAQALSIADDSAAVALTPDQVKLRKVEAIALSKQPNLTKIKRILKTLRED